MPSSTTVVEMCLMPRSSSEATTAARSSACGQGGARGPRGASGLDLLGASKAAFRACTPVQPGTHNEGEVVALWVKLRVAFDGLAAANQVDADSVSPEPAHTPPFTQQSHLVNRARPPSRLDQRDAGRHPYQEPSKSNCDGRFISSKPRKSL
jgi:hypothetical protein